MTNWSDLPRHRQRSTPETLPRLAYAGALLQPRDLAHEVPGLPGRCLIYHVFDRDGDLLYVGITATPKTRWQHHRLKAQWWPLAAHLVVYTVDEADQGLADQTARHWESVAIYDTLPKFNLHGPAALPHKQKAGL